MIKLTNTILMLAVFIGQIAHAGVDGVYRTNIAGMCAGDIHFQFTYDLTINKDNTFTAIGAGAYMPNYTTFLVSCEGTWERTQRQLHLDQATCDVTDLATYVTGDVAGPNPRILTDYANDSTNVILLFAVPGTQMFTLFSDPSDIETLTINNIQSERACSRQGVGIRLSDNNKTDLPIPVGPIDP